MKIIEIAMEIALPPELLEAVFHRHGFRPAREVAMSTSVGGIGPLLRERIVDQAEKGLEVIGVTLLYETTWIQNWFDWGQLHLEKRTVLPTVREFLTDTGIILSLPLYDGSQVKAQVWKTAYGKGTVYFLDCPPITQVVYPSAEDANPKEQRAGAWAEQLRFKQSWLVGRGALALAKTLNFQPDIVTLSETPTFLGHHRLVMDDFHDDPFFANTRYAFNDHTPLEYAHPVWPRKTLSALKMDVSTYVPPAGLKAESDAVDITRLLIGICQGVFGVSQKHGGVMRAMPSLQDFGPKIEAITNGVYVPYWQSPTFQNAAAISDDELIARKEKKKAELLDWVWRHYGLWHTWKEQVKGKAVVLWTRRITGYKRLDILWSLCKEPSLKKQFIESDIVLLMGGRIHQNDDQAQTMIYNILDVISSDPVLQERLVFLDNFNVWMAPRLFHGADAAVMLADDGREASATGFMKAQVNGDLIIATDDGAIPESVIFSGRAGDKTPNGFEVGYVNGHPTPDGLMRACRALRDVLQDRPRRAAMIRSALAAEPQVSVDRTVREMTAFYERLLAQSSGQPSIPLPAALDESTL